jgi:beta-glucosidase
VNPYALDSAYEAFNRNGISFDYADGYSLSDDNDHDDLISQAVEAARGKDIVYIFAGLPDSFESEGFDRQNLQLPRSHNRLIENIAAVNPNTAVVLQGGSPMEMPWAGKVKAILLCYLSGSQGGKAAVNLLLGRINPSGKLAETFPINIEDVASTAYFPGGDSAVHYRESIYVGYRYFDTAGKAVLFPFGHGLSYTQFRYDSLKIETGSAVSISFTITNVGSVAGKESVQLYVSRRSGSLFKAQKELKGFCKVSLNPGEIAEIIFTLDNSAFEYFNINRDCWHVESGSYDILIGASSRDIRLQDCVDIKGNDAVSVPDYKAEAPDYYNLPAERFSIGDASFRAVYGGGFVPADKTSKKPYHRNSTIGDIKNTLIGRVLMPVINRQVKTIADGSEEMKLMLNAMIMDMPLRTFVMASKGAMNCRRVDGLADLLNGNIIRGIRRIVTGR